MITRTRRLIAGGTLALTSLAVVASLLVAPEAAKAADAPKKVKITVKDSKLGRIMTDGDGNTLYMFTPDGPNISNCEGQCLVAWPPILVPKDGTLADVTLDAPSLRRSKLGYTWRNDGTRQVTYEGWPLYYWFRDKAPGDVTGQWVGNVWFVLNEHGTPNSNRI